MKREIAKLIQECFNAADEAYPDKSTEWLLALTADSLEIEYDEVVEALAIMAGVEE
jgi:hypothetical protein